MKLKNLSNEFIINDELLDLHWINNLNANQTFFKDPKKTFQSVDFSLDIDEINALVSNLPFNQNKSAEKKEASTIKEFGLISNPFYLYELEENPLELDFGFI